MSIYLLGGTLPGVFIKLVHLNLTGISETHNELGTQRGRVAGLASGPGEAELERGPWRGPHIGASTCCCLRFCLRLQVGKASLLGRVSAWSFCDTG